MPDNDNLDSDVFEKHREEETRFVPDDRDWYITRSDLKLGNPVGQGFFGMVFNATLTRKSGETEIVAVKRMKETVADFNHKDLEREIEIMKELRHPNIVEIIGIVDEQEMLLVMEFVGMGALPAYLDANKENLTHSELLGFGCDVASAMAYLERKKIIHRDLAARNILVKSERCVKLSDFGLAQLLLKDYYVVQTMHRNLPLMWYAPESILRNKFTMKSDVWSFGVTLWEMFTFGQDPAVLRSDNPVELGYALIAGTRLPQPERCPSDVYQIMNQCWRLDYNLRPSFATLLETLQNMVESIG